MVRQFDKVQFAYRMEHTTLADYTEMKFKTCWQHFMPLCNLLKPDSSRHAELWQHSLEDGGGVLIVGILSLNGGSPRTANAVYQLQSSLATQPSPAPCSRVRVTLMELMMKLRIAKLICLKLLRKLDKALQNDIFRGFWSAKPCKSGLQHCGALRRNHCK